jgi:DNA-damage-inducible protein J
MGLTMSAAITIFLRQVIAKRAIPFKISADPDRVYNPANMARLLQSIEQFKEGRVQEVSLEELEQLANE